MYSSEELDTDDVITSVCGCYLSTPSPPPPSTRMTIRVLKWLVGIDSPPPPNNIRGGGGVSCNLVFLSPPPLLLERWESVRTERRLWLSVVQCTVRDVYYLCVLSETCTTYVYYQRRVLCVLSETSSYYQRQVATIRDK